MFSLILWNVSLFEEIYSVYNLSALKNTSTWFALFSGVPISSRAKCPNYASLQGQINYKMILERHFTHSQIMFKNVDDAFNWYFLQTPRSRQKSKNCRFIHTDSASCAEVVKELGRK